MTTNSVQEKWNQPQEEDEDDEEALSLSDLPLSINQPSKETHSLVNETKEEFNFRSWVGLFSTEQEMCVADEVFFQGQILPSRVSFSSEAGLLTTGSKSKFQHNHDGKQFNFKSKQESFKHDSFNEFRSNSSTSQNSSTSSSSTSSNTNTNTKTTTQIVSISKTKVRNQFHTHPSPKPQLKLSCPRKSTQSRKSSKWEIFRLGVVPTPEIELQDLKVRTNTNSGVNKNCVSRNSSSSSSNSTKSGKMSKKNENGDKGNHFFKMFVGKGGGLLSGCDCSIETVINGDKNGTYKIESTKHAMKEKGMERKKHEKQRKKQGKKVMSRRRTFEWLKELHANHLEDEEALLSNSS